MAGAIFSGEVSTRNGATRNVRTTGNPGERMTVESYSDVKAFEISVMNRSKLQFDEEKETNQAIEKRKSMPFVPYIQERNPFGHLLSKGQSELTLQDKVKILAENHRRNPIKMTTSQNLRKTSQNARYKIIRQH